MITMTNDRAKAIVPRDWKYAPSLSVNEKLMHLTLIVCVSAEGCRTRHTLILPLKTFPSDLDPFITYFEWAGTAEGWITEDIFVGWVQKVLVPHVEAKRQHLNKPDARALLWLDGHTSRASSVALELMQSHNICCATIPGHTSHIVQPLDNGIFNIFKKELKRNFQLPDSSDTAAIRAELVKSSIMAIYHAMEPLTIKAAFARTGLVPYKPELILNDPLKVTPSPKKEIATSKTRGFSISNMVLTTPECVRLVKEAKEKQRKWKLKAAK